MAHISYLRNAELNATTALATLTDRNTLLIAKDNNGKIYVPSFNINTIGNLLPGQGYQMYISGTDTLIYPANGSAKPVSNEMRKSPEKLIPQNIKTGAEMTLILDGNYEDGVEAGIFIDDKLIGSGIFIDGIAPITIWGDDEYTEIKDGANENDILDLKLLIGDELIDVESEFTSLTGTIIGNELTFNKNSLVKSKLTVQEINNSAIVISPQPANNTLNVELNSFEGNRTIQIFDIKGKKVFELQTTEDNILIDLNSYNSGVYTIKANDATKTEFEKFMIKK
jgi:hypothetical protein